MKNFALGAFVSLLVAVAALHALAQSSEAQPGSEPPVAAERPAAAVKTDPSPPPLAKVGPPAPAAQSDEERVGSGAPRCYGIVAAVGELAASRLRARRRAEDIWMDRIRFDFGERYVDLNNAEGVSHVCAVAIPMSASIVIKKAYFRCKIWARPCRPPDGVMAKIERRYEEEVGDE
jgi:hypothetical protein